MINRINLILQAKNINARQFADEIGVQPSGVSHILSGRNNPSLDFVMKVMKRYPEINIQWLMFGKGEMFDTEGAPKGSNNMSGIREAMGAFPVAEPVVEKNDPHNMPLTAPAGQQDLFSFCNEDEDSPSGEQTAAVAKNAAEPIPPQTNVAEPVQTPAYATAPAPKATQASVAELAGTQLPVAEEPNYGPSREVRQEAAVRLEKLAMENVVPEEECRTVDSCRPIKTKKINKILVFYDDHTFAEYFPE